eukprot:gene1557-1897_t
MWRAYLRADVRAGPGASRSIPRSSGSLVALCETAYASYCNHAAAQVTLDTHLHNCLTNSSLSEEDARFVAQVVYGVLRYRKFINGFLDSFYHFNSGTALRSDAVKYRIIVYLAAFRLQELTFKMFRLLLEAQEPQKMLVLLRYLFDEQRLRHVCREDWLREYDKEFVDGTIAGLLAWKADSDALLRELSDKVHFTKKQQIPPLPKPRPPPKHPTGPTKEQLAIEAAREANKQAAQALLSDARQGVFRLRVLERPMQTGALRAEAQAELEAELAIRPKAKPAPPPPAAEVRLNAAAVLREDALYKRKQAEEAAALQRFQYELRDTAAFDRWQATMRAADAQQQAQRVEQLRQEMSTAAGAAAQAKADLLAAKATASGVEKAARAARDEQRQQVAAVEQQQKAAKAEEVAADRVRARQAQEIVAIEKKGTAHDVRQQLQQEARRRAEAAAKEAAERRDLIAQLRGLERAATIQSSCRGGASRGKMFDRTAVADLGMNNQMSLEELRARLAAARQRQLEEEERARAQILAARQSREATLTAKVTQLAAIRRLASAQANLRKAAAQTQRAQTAAAVLQHTESRALLLADRIDAKHASKAAEAGRLEAEERRIRFEQMQNAAGAAVVEANRFRELRDGAMRRCQQQQAKQLGAAAAEEAYADKLAATRQHNMHMRQHQHTALHQKYDQQLATALQLSQAELAQSSGVRKGAAARLRQHVQQHAQQHAQQAYKPFSSSHTTMQEKLQSLASGREL